MSPSWNELVTEVDKRPNDKARSEWVNARLNTALGAISKERAGRNVIFYASAFLQKPTAPSMTLMITHEEINGLMSVMFGMDFSKGLSLLLHTPGGIPNAAETIVAYLYSKFSYIEVIVPAMAMSAGTMLSLAADRIVMGRQSQLGPIDPQMPIGGRSVSARAVVDQFEAARKDVAQELTRAHVWAPVLQSMGPALLQEAQMALDFGEQLVAGWLAKRMCAGEADPVAAASKIAKHFNDASTHKSHGRRIDRDEARSYGVVVEDLEGSQSLQDNVLTAYHLGTIICEKSPAAKFLASNHNRIWMKNLGTVVQTP